MSTLEIPKRFFFRFNLRCKYLSRLWTPQKKEVLDESYRIPDFAELERENPDAPSKSPIDFRIGWNERGLSFSTTITGKKRSPWCKPTHPEESEGLQICIDTRDVRNVHRATRFCHRFAFLPLGQGGEGKNPTVLWFPIHRAKGHPNPVAVEKILIQSTIFKDGYRLESTIPENVLTGYEPLEFSVLGFHYYLVDQEIGNHPMLVGPPFPHDQDPSLWGSLELNRQ